MFPDALHILSEIPPRKGFLTKKVDAERRALNAWMDTLPGGADAIIPIGEVLGDGKNPEWLLPQYSVDGDGTHWSPAGVAVVVPLLQQTLLGASASQASSAVPVSVSESLRGLVKV
jgi:hypothetical protein